MTFLANMDRQRGELLRNRFAELVPDLRVVLVDDAFEKAAVRYLLTWQVPDDIGTAWPSLEVIFSLGAGADQFDLTEIPRRVPVVRLVSDNLTAMMQEYVTMAVLALHRDPPQYLDQQGREVWDQISIPPRASERHIGIMGLGHLGQGALRALRPFGFKLAGWARSPHKINGVVTFHGADGLNEFLKQTTILVCLLPLTKSTKRILDAALFDRLPMGAALVHAGRGPQLNHDALTTALSSGRLKAAVLDVTDPEPLPAGHLFWNHPQIIITPHIACRMRIEDCIPAVCENIRRHQRGESLQGMIDPLLGY